MYDIGQMTPKELKRLSRRDLLTLMLEQAKQLEKLREELEAERAENKRLSERLDAICSALTPAPRDRRGSARSVARAAEYVLSLVKGADVFGTKRSGKPDPK